MEWLERKRNCGC